MKTMPNDSEAASMLKYLNRQKDAPPIQPPVTVQKKRAKATAPSTPPGLSPRKRDGKNAAILCWSPYS